MKKFVVAITVAMFAGAAGAAMANTEMGTIKKIEDNKITVSCKKNTLKAGTQVELKATVKGAVASSCVIDEARKKSIELTCKNAAVKVGEHVSVKRIVAKTPQNSEAKRKPAA
jgi:hypothetical protein